MFEKFIEEIKNAKTNEALNIFAISFVHFWLGFSVNNLDKYIDDVIGAELMNEAKPNPDCINHNNFYMLSPIVLKTYHLPMSIQY